MTDLKSSPPPADDLDVEGEDIEEVGKPEEPPSDGLYGSDYLVIY